MTEQSGYKLLTVMKAGEIRETTAFGWNAESMMDTEYRRQKEDKRNHYLVLFYIPGGSIRSECRVDEIKKET